MTKQSSQDGAAGFDAAQIVRARVARRLLSLLLGGLVGLCATVPCWATAMPVEILSVRKIKSVEWVWNQFDTMTFSSDGTALVIAEQRPDGYVHLCAYETGTLRASKCLVRLHKSRASRYGGIDWPDDRIFIQAGGLDEALVGWVSVGGWEKDGFAEIDGVRHMRYVQGKEGMNPAWDVKTGGLYFRGAETIDGIYFERGSTKKAVLDDVELFAVGGKYIWFTTEFALRRLEEQSGRQQVVSKKGEFSVHSLATTSRDEVLFVRTDQGTGTSRLYGVAEGFGIFGPVFGPSNDGQIKFVRMSANGDQALLSVYDSNRSKTGRNLHHLYLLRLRWRH